MTTVTTVICSVIMFCVLIFVHELGHFLVAKACGVKVNEFALGMGPTLLKRVKGETTYALRALPIGGFCAMEGEDEDSDDSRAFNNKPAWNRALILFAGSAMNIVLCLLLVIIIVFYVGVGTTTIDEVQKDTPAYQAGIQSGDKIVEINNKPVESWGDITTYIGETKGTIAIEVERGGKNLTVETSTKKDKDGRQIIGILPVREHDPLTVIPEGAKSTWNMAKSMVTVLGQLFTGKISVDKLTGMVGIVAAINETVQYGFTQFLSLAAFISLNLAVVNLLPFPALDGGRLLFLVIRKITGRAITDEMEGKIHFVGIILLFGLMIYVTWNDILRLFS